MDSVFAEYVQASFVVYAINGCRYVVFTRARVVLPATRHIWLTNAPYVTEPCCFRITPVGPRPNCLLAKAPFVAVGIDTAGPTPQIKGLVLFGEIKILCTTSPSPLSLALAAVTLAW